MFVHTNLRLCEKVTDTDYEEKTVDWSESESDCDGEQDAESQRHLVTIRYYFDRKELVVLLALF